jgi:hypothetical protein
LPIVCVLCAAWNTRLDLLSKYIWLWLRKKYFLPPSASAARKLCNWREQVFLKIK